MRRVHFYIMGFIALVFGFLSLAEYVLVSYRHLDGWLTFYPPEQLDWLRGLPSWVHGLWAAQAVLSALGAVCLVTHLRPAVWMLGLSFFALVALYVWMLFLAAPTVIALVGGGWAVWAMFGLVLALSFLIYLYARQEKQLGEVL